MITIKTLLHKFNNAETTLEEEKYLKEYFLSNEVAEEYLPYKDYFLYLTKEKSYTLNKTAFMKRNKNKFYKIAFAASVLLAFSFFIYFTFYKNKDEENLGTFANAEQAMQETHKALLMVSENLNIGIENALYINEYEKTKKTIFK